MSVDKFGRHSDSRLQGMKGPKGDGFDITPEGDFDVNSKRLRHLNDPMESSDAVNLGYLRDNCISSSSSSTFDAKNRHIINIPLPKEADQAVNLAYLQSYCLQYGSLNELSPFIDVRNNILRNVQAPAGRNDAATKAYVDSKTPTGNQYMWEFMHRRLTNCSDPMGDSDAVTLRYFNNWSPKLITDQSTWSFLHYRLTDIGEPRGPEDAVTLKYLDDNAIVHKDAVNGFDAKNLRVSRLGVPRDIDDAVSKRYLKDALLSFGISMFKAIFADNNPTQDQLTFFIAALLKNVNEWIDK